MKCCLSCNGNFQTSLGHCPHCGLGIQVIDGFDTSEFETSGGEFESNANDECRMSIYRPNNQSYSITGVPPYEGN